MTLAEGSDVINERGSRVTSCRCVANVSRALKTFNMNQQHNHKKEIKLLSHHYVFTLISKLEMCPNLANLT